MVRRFTASGDDLTGQQKAVQQYLEVLAKAREGGPVDSLRWGSALARVSRLTGIPTDELNRRFSSRPAPAPPAGDQPPQPYPGRPWEPRKPYNPFRDDPNGKPQFKGKFKKGGPSGYGGPFASGRGGYRRDDAPVPYRPPAGTPPPATARDTAERWILAVLLAEPGLWAGLVDKVHVSDFTDDGRRRLAELYWQHQQDEGEPAFNEFLDVLRSASEEDGSPDLASLAVGLVAELDDRTGGEATEVKPADLLKEAVALLAEMRARRRAGQTCGPTAAYKRCRRGRRIAPATVRTGRPAGHASVGELD